MRPVPGQHERNPLAFRDCELRHRRESFATQVDVGAEAEGVWTSHRGKRSVATTHPGNDRAVVKADDQLDLIRTWPRRPRTIRMRSGSPFRGGMQSTTVIEPSSVS